MATALEVFEDDPDRGALEDRPKPGLALTQRVFGSLPLRHIAKAPDPTNDLSAEPLRL
jgi:hypothetical protein